DGPERRRCTLPRRQATQGGMLLSVETPSLFAQAIQEHLELKQRNAAIERVLPLDNYKAIDPFENHPLFKTEEQARLEETLDGTEPAVDAIVAEAVEPEVALQAWTEQAAPPVAEDEDGLWGRSRDFDWGD